LVRPSGWLVSGGKCSNTSRHSRLPWVLWLPAVLALALVVLPVVGLLLRSDLTRFPSLVTSPPSLQALRLSLVTAALSTAVCVLLGVPLAVVLARSRLRGIRVLRAVVLLPLVLPPVVGGLALLYLLGRKGFLGYLLNVVAGVQVPFTTGAVVIAQTFVAMPFLVVSMEGALRGGGDRYEQVAATLGARPWTVFRRVTVPLLLPALGSGMVLSFARALGEFGATITFAGSLEGVTRTLPLEVYTQTEVDVDSAVALSLLLIVVAVLVIALARPRALEGVRA
jgi:molybdate transport system permease protein